MKMQSICTSWASQCSFLKYIFCYKTICSTYRNLAIFSLQPYVNCQCEDEYFINRKKVLHTEVVNNNICKYSWRSTWPNFPACLGKTSVKSIHDHTLYAGTKRLPPYKSCISGKMKPSVAVLVRVKNGHSRWSSQQSRIIGNLVFFVN